MTDNIKYHSINKGVDYDILLKHFKGQAEGATAPYLTSSRFHNKRTPYRTIYISKIEFDFATIQFSNGPEFGDPL